MESQNILKLVFIFVFFAEAFFMGILPVKLKRFRNSVTALGLSNSFAGGVFIAIALLHIIPEMVRGWDAYACEHWPEIDEDTGEKECGEPYPVPLLLTVVGYTLILVLDKVLFDSHALLHDDKAHPGDQDFVRKSITKASLVVQEQMKRASEDGNMDPES